MRNSEKNNPGQPQQVEHEPPKTITLPAAAPAVAAPAAIAMAHLPQMQHHRGYDIYEY